MKKLFHIIILVSTALLFVACGNSNSTSQSEKVSVTFDYSLSAIKVDEQNINRSAIRDSSVVFIGKLKIYDPSADMDNENFKPLHEIKWSANINKNNWTGFSNKTVMLIPGEYQFELTLSNGYDKYIGRVKKYIKESENLTKLDIPLKPNYRLLHLNDNETINDLSEIKFNFFEELDVSHLKKQYKYPKLVLKLNEYDPAVTYLINPEAKENGVYIKSLPPGKHKIIAKLYDGSTLIGRTPKNQEYLYVHPAIPTDLPIERLQAKVSFIQEALTDDINVTYKIPKYIIDEVDTKNTIIKYKTKIEEDEKIIQLKRDKDNDIYTTSFLVKNIGNQEMFFSMELKKYKNVVGTIDFEKTLKAKGITETILVPIDLDTAKYDTNSNSALNFYTKFNAPIGGVRVWKILDDNTSEFIGISDSSSVNDFNKEIHLEKGSLKRHFTKGTHTIRIEKDRLKKIHTFEITSESSQNYVGEEIDIYFNDPKDINTTDAYIVKIDRSKTNELSSEANKYKIYADHTQYNYDYSVDCNNDGVYEAKNQSQNYTCEYSDSDKYEVAIYGTYPRIGNAINHNDATDNIKILSVLQWGSREWKSMEFAFNEATNLTSLPTNKPDLSKTKSMKYMFNNAINFNQDISNWDVSKIENMMGTFRETKSFYQNLSDWNVSKVTNYTDIFFGSPKMQSNDAYQPKFNQ